ncbi:MAG: DUF3990 domain-containing protein [Coriobacteriales bacterium]|jgi:hypothetical protein|nr:DUF3990 domain-containing protein [Coriobacteriales bacterium]
MRLYHGSNRAFARVDLEKCRPYKDFGRGVYLTRLEAQAQDWAQKVTARAGTGRPIVMLFDFDETALLRLDTLVFGVPDARWAHFVMNNRNRSWTAFDDPLSNHDAKYDLVEGPVANDDIATTFSLFVRGLLDGEMLAKQLAYKDLNHQMSFHTERAVAYLRSAGSYELD